MALLVDPVAPDARRVLRTAVVLAAGERRRRPATLSVGTPGGPVTTIVDDPGWDHGLRVEMVGAALRARADPPWVWVTRSGPLDLQDVDAAWLGPALTAAAEREVDIAFVVVTRYGWTDPRSGTRREWKRIRRPRPTSKSAPRSAPR